MNTIGIAIITYKRPKELKRCLDLISLYPTDNAEVVIFDDCSLDETVLVANDYGKYISPDKNSGVVGNKNRAIYYFTEISKKDVVILMEDDVCVMAGNWLELWVSSAIKYGHMNFSAPWFKHESLIHQYVSGNGSVDSPDVYQIVTGQCTSFLRSHIITGVGYLNPLFKGFGYGHVEWTNRFIRQGLGGYFNERGPHYFCISGGIEAPATPSFKNNDELNLNEVVYKKIASKHDVNFVEHPWLDNNSKVEFLKPFA